MLYPRLTILPILMSLLAAHPGAISAADAPTPPAPAAPAPGAPISSDSPPAVADGDSAKLRAQAEAAAAEGMQAMREADADPHRGVDAAIDFSHALTAYDHLGDTDAVCEMQADIYWCKKRMNLDNLEDYVAKKGDVAKRDFTTAQQVINKTAPPEEAAAYIERADKYRLANPDRHFEIAIRYSEIVERFPDTEQGHQASQVFTAEQALYLAQVEHDHQLEQAQLQHALANRSSRFTEVAAVSNGSTPIPTQAALEAAQLRVRKVYHDDLQHAGTEARKRSLARRIAREAEQSRDDAALYDALLEDSKRLAMDSEDYETILSDIEHQAVVFQGFDPLAAKKLALTHLQSHPTAAAILKLLGDPSDKASNLMVGKFYCYILHRWDDGVKMLALGSAADLAKVAEMEIAQPKTAPEQRATADAWLAIGALASGTDRAGAYQRAEYWYDECEPFLTGVNKVLVNKNLDLIAKVIPATIADWTVITLQQWNRLRGRDLDVDARMGRSDAGFSIMEGQQLRLVACPSDHWRWSTSDNQVFECDSHGGTPDFPRPRGRRNNGGGNGFPEGALTMSIDDGPHQALGIASGPGHLFLQPENPWNLFGGGDIRVKVLKISDDD